MSKFALPITLLMLLWLAASFATINHVRIRVSRCVGIDDCIIVGDQLQTYRKFGLIDSGDAIDRGDDRSLAKSFRTTVESGVFRRRRNGRSKGSQLQT